MSTNTAKTIEIVIGPTGEATVQTRGFAGAACRDASRYLEQALGERTAERLTAEYHQPLDVPAQAEQRG